jgi:hypothetical protein
MKIMSLKLSYLSSRENTGSAIVVVYGTFREGSRAMAWDADYALLGIYLFGDGLNVHDYVIDPNDNNFGYSTDDYWVAHFLLDNDNNIATRLKSKMQGPNIEYFPVLRLLRRTHISSPSYPQWAEEKMFFKPWLMGLLRDYGNPRSGFRSWGDGWTLAIGFYKKDNPSVTVASW